jgi:transcription initiation factor TFIIH subunit 2
MQAIDEDGLHVAYKWEQGIQASWESVQEDAEGRIVAQATDRERSWRAKRQRITQSIRRGLIRFMVVALDCSGSAEEKDYRPSRLEVCKQALQRFIRDYFDQNPISQLSVAVARDRVAEKISDLSGNAKLHVNYLQGVITAKGLASLQNTINLSISTLRHVPNYGHRELLVVYNSLGTCDPGNIFASIEAAKAHKLRISVICLAAELFICKQVAELTGGTFSVALDAAHLADLLQFHTTPPPELAGSNPLVTDFVYMGFPKRALDMHPVFSYEGKRLLLAQESYICPRCATRSTDIPTQCMVCCLQLNSSSHIARSYHHLFPVPAFVEHALHANPDGSWQAVPSAREGAGPRAVERCRGCLASLDRAGALVLRCPRCDHFFCVDCDLFIHDQLHNCPGCC